MNEISSLHPLRLQLWHGFHAPLKLAVLAAFRRSNWHQVPDEMVEETIADVVVSFFKAEFTYDPAKGRFRN